MLDIETDECRRSNLNKSVSIRLCIIVYNSIMSDRLRRQDNEGSLRATS